MYRRSLLWLVTGALVALVALRAQTPAPAPMPEGLVLVAKTTGEVTKTLAGTIERLKADDRVEQAATINTAQGASAVLVFSNGAILQLESDTELTIEQYLQDPFAATIKVAELEREPSKSHTKLMMNRGELIGKVKLRVDQGSTFTVQTPVGAAGIRGTTFRIVFRPAGAGQAFFNLSTVEGDITFTPPGTGGTDTPAAGGTAGSPAATPDPTAPGGAPDSTPGAAPQPGAQAGVAVVGGQEIVINVAASINATTGQIIVAAPPTSRPTVVQISAVTQAAVAQQAQNMAITTAAATFTSPAAPPPAPAAGAAPTPGAGGTTGSASGGTTGSATGSATGGTTGTTGTTSAGSGTAVATTPSQAQAQARAQAPVTTPPAATPPPPRLTPGG